MAFSIAVAGKGGTGKTSISGLLVRYLVEKNKKPVLAVDADANANLNEVLGVNVPQTVGHVREDVLKRGGRVTGISQEEFIELRLHESLVEAKGYDLLVMGRPEGPGCYCYANNIIRKYSERLSEDYKYIVMDNEAGLEHLSRRTTEDVDILLTITDSSIRSIRTAGRVRELIDELKLSIKKQFLIVNMSNGELQKEALEAINDSGMEFLGAIPRCDVIQRFDSEGSPLYNLPENSDGLRAVFSAFDKLNLP